MLVVLIYYNYFAKVHNNPRYKRNMRVINC